MILLPGGGSRWILTGLFAFNVYSDGRGHFADLSIRVMTWRFENGLALWLFLQYFY